MFQRCRKAALLLSRSGRRRRREHEMKNSKRRPWKGARRRNNNSYLVIFRALMKTLRLVENEAIFAYLIEACVSVSHTSAVNFMKVYFCFCLVVACLNSLSN